MGWAKTIARNEKHLRFRIWCDYTRGLTVDSRCFVVSYDIFSDILQGYFEGIGEIAQSVSCSASDISLEDVVIFNKTEREFDIVQNFRIWAPPAIDY